MTDSPLSRRAFLAAAAGAAGLAACTASPVRPAFRDDPFPLGVASGDPVADSVVLWTRLPAAPPAPVEVDWELAEDEAFSKGLRRGRILALPELAHSVHVEVPGLDPGRAYTFRFRVAGHESPAGRTRTLPAPGSTPTRLRLAVASCQHFEHGLFTALEHLAREDADLVIHLGDYIYEGAASKKGPRFHDGPECTTLEGYRARYALYKADPALRAAHAAAPWLVTPDDHELDNNCANAVSEEKGVTPEAFLRRRAAAYQAYYEHQPLRLASIPRGPDMRLHRRFSWGRLAELFVLDTRQYRTDQPCGDGNKPPCPEVMDPAATLLGREQRDWLFDGLGTSGAAWNVLAQQVMVARVDRKPGEGAAYSMDQWPGYEVERRALVRRLKESRNPVVLAGDIHSNWANELGGESDALEGPPVAAEFVGTSISSGGDGTAAPKDLDRLLSENPFVRFHNTERGYLRCDVDGKAWRTDFRTVPYVLKPGAPVVTRASWAVEAGRPGLQRA